MIRWKIKAGVIGILYSESPNKSEANRKEHPEGRCCKSLNCTSNTQKNSVFCDRKSDASYPFYFILFLTSKHVNTESRHMGCKPCRKVVCKITHVFPKKPQTLYQSLLSQQKFSFLLLIFNYHSLPHIQSSHILP